MNTLYHVALYNRSRNEWARILCTADSEGEAIEQTEFCLSDGADPHLRKWLAKTAQAICQTPIDYVWTEV